MQLVLSLKLKIVMMRMMVTTMVKMNANRILNSHRKIQQVNHQSKANNVSIQNVSIVTSHINRSIILY